MSGSRKKRSPRKQTSHEHEREDFSARLKAALASPSACLNLTSLNIGDAGASTVAHSIVTNACFVTTLVLQSNDIWTDGAIAIAKALSNEHCAVEKLDMGHNNVGSVGAFHLAESFKVNKRLTSVFLNDNDIDDEGADYILTALYYNSKLREVNLVGNLISDRSILTKIQDKTKQNAQSRVLSASDNLLQRDILRLNAELQAEREKSAQLEKELVLAKNATTRLKSDHALALLAKKDELYHMQQRYEDNQVASEACKAIYLRQTAETTKDYESMLEKFRNEILQLVCRIEVMEVEKSAIKETKQALESEKAELLIKVHDLAVQQAKYDISHTKSFGVEELTKFEEELDSIIKHVRDVKTQKLRKVHEDVLESRKCKVCFEESIDTILFPCRHLIMCQGCSQKVVKCPLCSTVVASRVRVFEG